MKTLVREYLNIFTHCLQILFAQTHRWSVLSSSSSSAVYMNDWCGCCVHWRRLYSSSKFQQGNQELILGNGCHRPWPSLPRFLRHVDHLVYQPIMWNLTIQTHCDLINITNDLPRDEKDMQMIIYGQLPGMSFWHQCLSPGNHIPIHQQHVQ